MANNNVSSLFNIDLPDPKRSNFNLGRTNRFTADNGWLIPCYVEEVLPNSYKRLDLEALIQTNATVAPLMGSFKVKIDAFFVPRRLYHQHLDLNNIRPNFTDDFDYHFLRFQNGNPVSIEDNSILASISNVTSPRPFTITLNNIHGSGQDPYTARTNLTVAPSSLLDYLGCLPVGYSCSQWNSSLDIDALPFIGYFDIFRNYYSNPHDQFVPFRTRNFSSNILGFASSSYSNDRFVKLSAFDDFIRKITLGSLSDTGPLAVNVLEAFGTCFNFEKYDSLRTGFNYPPLFAGQLTNSGAPGLLPSSNLASDTRDGRHFGLLRRTYMDDYFNSRFMNSFVSYMEESSKVEVRDNTFTITQLRLANRIAKYVDKSIFSDTRFGSWIKAHFGVKTNQKLCIPQFLGSISSNIIFNDIYASAQTGDGDITSNQALGSRASLGQGYIKNKGSFIEFQATEPGVIICLFSIIPYTSYFQGIKKMYLKTKFSDMYTPEYDAVGYDDLQKLEMSAVPNYIPVVGTTNVPLTSHSSYNVSIGKHPAWIEYMTSYDECHGLMTQRDEFGYWLLNRPFSPYSYDHSSESFFPSQVPQSQIPADLQNVFESSTYINPDYYNTIFAVDRYTDNFQVQIRFYDKTKQPISKQILPHL